MSIKERKKSKVIVSKLPKTTVKKTAAKKTVAKKTSTIKKTMAIKATKKTNKSPGRKTDVEKKGKVIPAGNAKPRKTQVNGKVSVIASGQKRKTKTLRPNVAVRSNVAGRAGLEKKLKVAIKKDATSKGVVKSVSNNIAERVTSVEKHLTQIRNEFKKILKVEVAAAFDVCLAAMENATNIMESRLATVLGEMSTLVTGAKPDFKDGKLKSIVSDDGNERTDFSYANDGLVTSRTYRDGKLKFEIVHGKLGSPISGKMFDPSGKVVKEFSYGPDGQVK
jgi:hypothetical protein